MTMLELKPCPHCGNRTKPKVMDWDGAGFPGYEVRCDASGWEGLDERGCGAAGGWGETPDEAVTSWNRRTLPTITPAEVGGLVERLRKRADRYCTQSVREEAASLIQSQAARIAELEAVLRATRTLVSEAALTGFNCHEGKWAEQLYANQAAISKMVDPPRRSLPNKDLQP